jgi:pimeloyl-ACP methyl ester carboxylesterase
MDLPVTIYSMNLLSKAALILAGGAVLLSCSYAATETGDINGAKFRIDMPANWNGGLVMYCHGYNPKPGVFDEKSNPFLNVFLDQGYAIAQSGYASGGWAIQEATVDTENLRRYFVRKYGKPKETYITGHSMGGFLTMMIIEQYPSVYDAAMPMCGPLAPPMQFLARGAFDSRVLFDYYFPGALPGPLGITAEFQNTPELATRIESVLDAAPEKAAILKRQNGTKSNKDLAGVLTFLTYMLKELQERAGGNPFDNRNIIYSNTDDDNVVNAGVKRYTADPKATEYVRTFYTPTGHIARPVLAIHTSYDPLVPVSVPNNYQTLVDSAGTSSLFVQQYVKHDGHCRILPEEVQKGFSQLREWKSSGVRPKAGDQAAP